MQRPRTTKYWVNYLKLLSKFLGDTNLKTEMTLRCLNAIPKGSTIVRYTKSGDEIVIKKANTHVYNLIVGEMFIHHSGILSAVNTRTGDTMELELKEKPFFGDPETEVLGWVKDSMGEVKYIIKGDWKTHLQATNIETEKTTMLVEKIPDPDQFAE
jgi:hypothetical protein